MEIFLFVLMLASLVPLVFCERVMPELMRDGYIMGGKEAEPGSWPWQTSLQKGGYHNCGGSLISSHWVVTAAHCVPDPPETYSVVMGLHDKRRKTGDPKDYSISKIIKHPSYDRQGRGFPNDIALIQLKEAVDTSSQYISTIPMATSGESFVGQQDCYITGWGKTDNWGYPTVLLEAQVEVYSEEQCKDRWGGAIGDYHVCVGKYYVAGSCSGDSGGPLVCPRKGGEWVLVGATSWGQSQCATYMPSVYSSIAYFRDWIQATTGI